MNDDDRAAEGSAGELANEYLRSALEWGAAANDSRKANPLFERNHSLYKRMRETEAGRDAISRLMTDPEPAVRLLAATHSLAWRGDEAVAVLEEIERGGGLTGTTAKYTLKGYRAGSLNLDW